MSDQAAGQAVAEGGEAAAPEAPAVDFSPVMSEFQALRGEIGSVRDDVARMATPPAEEEPEPEFDLSWLDGGVEPDVGTQLQQQMQSFVQQQVAQQAAQAGQAGQQALQQLAEMRRVQAAQQLVSEFPELGQPETANVVVQGSAELAQHISSDLGLDSLGLPPDVQAEIVRRIGDSPALWRASYKAGKADSFSAAEDADGGAPAHLEGGSGSGPVPGGPDLAARIVSAGGGDVLPV